MGGGIGGRRALIIATLGVVLAREAAGATAAGAPRLVIEAPVFDFGTVDRGSAVAHAFNVRNAGSAPLRIEHVKSSCACTVAAADGREVAPGDETTVEVRLDSARLTGHVTKSVTLYTNDPDTPAASLTLDGQVTADLVVTPTPLYLGRIRRGEPLHRELRVSPGRPGEAGAVAWVENSSPRLRTTLEALPDRSGQRILVDLDSSLPLGRFNDQLTLHTTSRREPTLTVPVFGSVEGDVVVLPPQVTFGVAPGGDVAPRELYIRNRGSRPLAVTDVVVPREVVTYELETLKEGIEYRLTLRLRAGLSAGKVEGAVEIFTDHPDEGHIVVPLYAIVRADPPRSELDSPAR